MQHHLILASNLRVLVVMDDCQEQRYLVENIEKIGLQVDVLATIPDVLRMFSHICQYDIMFIAIHNRIDNIKLVSFMHSEMTTKTPYLIGIALELSASEQKMWIKHGLVNECIEIQENIHRISNIANDIANRISIKNGVKRTVDYTKNTPQKVMV